MNISIDGLTVRRKRHVVIDNLDLSLGAGLSVFMGPNGAGKSSLVLAMAGAIPFEGTIAYGAMPLTPSNRREIAATIGFAPQSVRWPRRMTALEVCRLAADLRGVAPTRAQAAAESALDQVEMYSLASRRVGSLSGGEHRRLTIAQAIVHSPEYLIFDEPTAELDPIFCDTFSSLMRQLKESHTIIATTHSVEDAAAWGGNLFVVHGGKVTTIAAPNATSDLSGSAAQIRARFKEVVLDA